MDEVKIYGRFDRDGTPLAFYTSDIHPTPPKDAVEITKDQWGEMLNNQGISKFVKGKVVVSELKPMKAEPVRDLFAEIDELKAQLKAALEKK